MFDLSQVPLFRGMDDLILDNICDRAKPRVFSKDEKVLIPSFLKIYISNILLRFRFKSLLEE